MRRTIPSPCLPSALLAVFVACAAAVTCAAAPNPNPPAAPVKLVFIHHSTGENWLNDDHGKLCIALRNNNYFVSDTNYGWGPADADVGSDMIGDHTDLGHWYNWFAGPHRDTYLAELFAESGQSCEYSRLATDPGGPNQIVMFKSCFPNSKLYGSADDPVPAIGENPLRGQDAGSGEHTVANAKGIYVEILKYFATRPDKLFIAVTAPPLGEFETEADEAANARAFDNWLVQDWLKGYPQTNVFVFDFYNVLTSNGGPSRTDNPNVHDLGAADGNHHRWRDSAVQHLQTVGNNFSKGGLSGIYTTSSVNDDWGVLATQTTTGESYYRGNTAVKSGDYITHLWS
jgi:hypothetical protein